MKKRHVAIEIQPADNEHCQEINEGPHCKWYDGEYCILYDKPLTDDFGVKCNHCKQNHAEGIPMRCNDCIANEVDMVKR